MNSITIVGHIGTDAELRRFIAPGGGPPAIEREAA